MRYRHKASYRLHCLTIRVATKTKLDHPTQKPVELMRRPILNHLKYGELVYEPVLGKRHYAAELTKRVCLRIQLEPKYMDVIVQRWQTLSGKKAKLSWTATGDVRRNHGGGPEGGQ
jgi:DNA modification methylase